jgi:hypothetical protein
MSIQKLSASPVIEGRHRVGTVETPSGHRRETYEAPSRNPRGTAEVLKTAQTAIVFVTYIGVIFKDSSKC